MIGTWRSLDATCDGRHGRCAAERGIAGPGASLTDRPATRSGARAYRLRSRLARPRCCGERHQVGGIDVVGMSASRPAGCLAAQVNRRTSTARFSVISARSLSSVALRSRHIRLVERSSARTDATNPSLASILCEIYAIGWPSTRCGIRLQSRSCTGAGLVAAALLG